MGRLCIRDIPMKAVGVRQHSIAEEKDEMRFDGVLTEVLSLVS